MKSEDDGTAIKSEGNGLINIINYNRPPSISNLQMGLLNKKRLKQSVFEEKL